VEIHHDLQLSSTAKLSQSLFWVKGEGYFDFGGTFRSANYLRLPDDFVPNDQRDLPLFLSKPEASVLFRAYLDQWQVGWVPRVIFSSNRATTTLGLEARLHRSTRWGRMQEGVGVPQDLVGPENDARVYSFRSEKKMLSAFGSTVYRLNDKWSAQADLQVTYRSYRFYEEAFFENAFEKPYVFLNPRIGVLFNPGERTSVYTSIAYAQREPRMKSLYDGEEAGAGFVPAFERHADGSWDTDKPFVSSENLIDVELGASYTTERMRLAANLFYMDFNDEIIASGGLDQFGVPRSGNAEKSVHAGIELEAGVSLGLGLQLNGNATISKNRFKKFTEYVTLADFSVAGLDRSDNTIAGFPDNSASIGLVYVRKGLNAELHLAYVGKAYVDNSQASLPDGTYSDVHVIDAYTMLDLVAGYEFPASSPLANLRINGALNNVLNQKVLQYGSVGFPDPQFFPAATRHVYIGLRYTIK
jgi:iron complex outermembrane receptor protein